MFFFLPDILKFISVSPGKPFLLLKKNQTIIAKSNKFIFSVSLDRLCRASSEKSMKNSVQSKGMGDESLLVTITIPLSEKINIFLRDAKTFPLPSNYAL